MKPLRFAMLTTFYPPASFGGDAIGVQRLAHALVARGHDVTVVRDLDAYRALSGRDAPPGDIARQGPRIVTLESRGGSLSTLCTHQLGRPVAHRAALRRLLAPGAFDVVWFHNVSLLGGPGLLGYGDGLKVYEAHEHWLVCPTHVLWRHNRELCDRRECLRCTVRYRRPPQLWRYTGLLERKLAAVDAFIAKSEFSRRKHAEFGFPRPMEVVPYFLPVEQGEPPSAPPRRERPYFLFVGRLEKIKGLDEVLPLMRRRPEVDLVVIGDGEHAPELKRQAADLPNVQFLGRLAPEELSAYYRGAVALVVPSVCFETFGIILIEAFRQGTPVVARRLGPFVEIVEQAGGGILYDGGDELGRALDAMLSERATRDGMARSAHSRFLELWSEDAVMKRYFRTLAAAAERAGRAELTRRLLAEAGA